MKKTITITAVSLLLAVSGAAAQSSDPVKEPSIKMQSTEPNTGTGMGSGMNNGSGTRSGSTMMNGTQVDPGTTNSTTQTNSDCTPPTGTNPPTETPAQRAPALQSCGK